MAIHKLTTAKIAKLTKNGMYGDGGGLWLQVTGNGTGKSWVFRWTERNTGKGRAMGLGGLYQADVHQARELAKKQWDLIGQGKDPIEERDGHKLDEDHKRRLVKTVNQVIDEFLDVKIDLPDRRSKKSVRYCLNHARATIGDLPIQKVKTATIMDVVGLRKMWTEQPHKAARLQNYLQRIFKLATASGYYVGQNPAQWDNHLEHMLPKYSDVHRVKHMPSLSYKEAGLFLEALRAFRDTSRRGATVGRPNSAFLLEFIILNGCRSGEARLARWNQIDRQNAIWTVPPENHKIGDRTRQPILRPISKAMLAVLDEMEQRYPTHAADALIFPSPYAIAAPYHYVTLSDFVQLLKWPIKVTAHGFRSTFTDWCRANGYSKELYDAQTGHIVGDQVARAYARDQLVDQRRPMMDKWGEYCSRPAPEPIEDGSNVINIRRNAS